jgi:hypothetical protein
MLPGSILPTSLQIAAMDSHQSACENEEEYAQKYGRAVRRFTSGRSKYLPFLVRPLAWIIYAILILAYVLT